MPIALGMPGFFEWIIILVILAALIGGAILIARGGRPPREPRGFDVEPTDRRDPQ